MTRDGDDERGDLSSQELALTRAMRRKRNGTRSEQAQARSAAFTAEMALLPRCERYAVLPEENVCRSVETDGGPCALCREAARTRTAPRQEDVDRIRADRVRYGKGNA